MEERVNAGMVSLRDFVSNTIKEISEGLHDAQEEKRKEGVRIFPDSYGDRSTPTDIVFDLSITSIAESKEGGNLEIRVPLLCVNMGGKKGLRANVEALNRIHFTIPVNFVICNTPDSQAPKLQPPTRVTEETYESYNF